MNFRKSIFSSFSPKLLSIISVVSVIGIIVTLTLEYNARKNDYLMLLEKQARLFINSLSSSTQNAITAAEKIEKEINSRILVNLKIIQRSNDMSSISSNKLNEIMYISNFDALILYNSKGELVQSVSKNKIAFVIPQPLVKSLIQKTVTDTILTIYDEPDYEIEQLVAISKNRSGGILVAYINDNDIKSLKSSIGIGYFLKRFQSKENVQYVVIQNSLTIVAGSFGDFSLSTFSQDSILQNVLNNNETQSRVLYYDNKPVFETISPFGIDGEPYGILRLGLAMEEYERLEADMTKRFIIISVVVAILAFIFFNFFINYKHRQLLNRDLGQLRNSTNTILENLSSGVICISDGLISTINKKATELLEIDYDTLINKSLEDLPNPWHQALQQITSTNENSIVSKQIKVMNKVGYIKLFAIRNDRIKNEEGNVTSVIILDDITEQTQLEEQLKRNQKLSAMSNLASSVAHEIKNPLNAIKLIIDLVRKKFKPSQDEEAYTRNMNTVSMEIDRVNNIIEQYLRFNRMPEMNLQEIDLTKIINEVCGLFESDSKQKNISLRCNVENRMPIKGDNDQLKQAFINLLKNAEEAIEQSGEISITGKSTESYYEIIIKDNGKGIPEENLELIFDLHFSTKKNGSGIGLSVVQQIIFAHKSKIYVESEPGEGTSIIIHFPISN